MSKRYGRNQKRKHKQTIEELKKQLADSIRSNTRLSRLTQNAKEEAFQEFLRRSDIMKEAILEMTYHLTKEMTPELAKEAQKILEAGQRQRNMAYPIDFFVTDYNPMKTQSFVTIQGSVPSFHYVIHIA